MQLLLRVTVLLCVFAATRAFAQEEVITDVQVKGALRTSEQTVRSISGIDIGDTLHNDTLDTARERLHTSGMFADINVYWEPHGVGVRVIIVVKEKFPWAPLPTFSYSPGDISAGGLIAHGNLFGLGKRGLIGGRISTVNSGAIAAYEDPAVFGSWGYFTLKGKYQSQSIPEYANVNTANMPLAPIRDTMLRTYGFEVSAGVAWFRRVKTAVGWNIDRNDVRSSLPDEGNSVAMQLPYVLPAATKSARRGSATVNLTFDFRARERAVMYGNALGFNLEYAAPRWGSQSNLWYWKASVSYEHGIRFFRSHNLVIRTGAIAGQNLPLWSENSAGGTNLRGYLYHQFQGDTHALAQIEYHFPLFSLWQLDVRGLLFSDNAAIWWRELPQKVMGANGEVYAERGDGRQFLPPEFLEQGFKSNRDIHSSAGAGLRFYLRTVAVPLVGFDVGNGLGHKEIRVIVVLGV
jgi:outer membrane protein insertion porin family